MDSPINVLHVDDEPGLAELATTFLERENDRITATTATSAAEARERLEADPPDCIVSDHDMPGETGLELLKDVRELDPRLPFILYTGKGSETIASEAISAGVTDYLQKQGGRSGEYTVLANRVQNAVERYHAHEALEESQQRLSLFIDQSPLGVVEYDADFEIVRVNEKVREIFGYDGAELTGHTWEIFVTDDSYRNVDGLTDELAKASGGFHSIDENVRSDGERITVEWFNRVITDDSGEAVAVFSLCRDVTDRERTRSRLQALYENSPDMINIHDTEGNIINPNPQLCEQTGYDSAELTSMKVCDVDANLSPAEARELWAGVDPNERRQVRGRYERKDGSTIPVEVHLRRVNIRGEKRFVVSARDISERVEYEEAVERTNSLLSTLIEALPAGVLVEDSTRNVLITNQRLLDQFGVPGDSAEVAGADCDALVEDVADRFENPTEFVEGIDELLDRQEPVAAERLHLDDGRVFERTYQPVTLPQGTGHMWVYRDVTERAERDGDPG